MTDFKALAAQYVAAETEGQMREVTLEASDGASPVRLVPGQREHSQLTRPSNTICDKQDVSCLQLGTVHQSLDVSGTWQ